MELNKTMDLFMKAYKHLNQITMDGFHNHTQTGISNTTKSEPVKICAKISSSVTLIILLLSACWLWPLSAQANIGARPAYLFVDLSKKNPSGTFTISNLSDEEQTYRARAIHFELKENGSIFPVKPDEHSLAEWIKFNPKEFTLPPKSSRVVRFTITSNKQNLKTREYWGAIEFTPLSGASFSNEDEEGHMMEFKVITTLLIPIYGQMPDTEYAGQISNITAEQSDGRLQLSALVENVGDGGIRTGGSWQIFDKDSGELVKQIPASRFLVLPQQKRHIVNHFDEHLPAGKYTVTLSLEYRKDKILSGQGEVELH